MGYYTYGWDEEGNPDYSVQRWIDDQGRDWGSPEEEQNTIALAQQTGNTVDALYAATGGDLSAWTATIGADASDPYAVINTINNLNPSANLTGLQIQPSNPPGTDPGGHPYAAWDATTGEQVSIIYAPDGTPVNVVTGEPAENLTYTAPSMMLTPQEVYKKIFTGTLTQNDVQYIPENLRPLYEYKYNQKPLSAEQISAFPQELQDFISKNPTQFGQESDEGGLAQWLADVSGVQSGFDALELTSLFGGSEQDKVDAFAAGYQPGYSNIGMPTISFGTPELGTEFTNTAVNEDTGVTTTYEPGHTTTPGTPEATEAAADAATADYTRQAGAVTQTGTVGSGVTSTSTGGTPAMAQPVRPDYKSIMDDTTGKYNLDISGAVGPESPYATAISGLPAAMMGQMDPYSTAVRGKAEVRDAQGNLVSAALPDFVTRVKSEMEPYAGAVGGLNLNQQALEQLRGEALRPQGTESQWAQLARGQVEQQSQAARDLAAQEAASQAAQARSMAQMRGGATGGMVERLAKMGSQQAMGARQDISRRGAEAINQIRMQDELNRIAQLQAQPGLELGAYGAAAQRAGMLGDVAKMGAGALEAQTGMLGRLGEMGANALQAQTGQLGNIAGLNIGANQFNVQNRIADLAEQNKALQDAYNEALQQWGGQQIALITRGLSPA